MTRRLIQQGHRAIGFAGAAAGHQWVQDRLRGYRQALSTGENSPQPAWEWIAEPGEKPFFRQDGARAAESLLSQPLTGVVAASDIIALGFWDACRSGGLDIPGQLSLVGFDNDPAALTAGLTTIERPSAALGEAAARAALERIAGGHPVSTVTVRLQPVLIERRSVRSRLPEEGACALLIDSGVNYFDSTWMSEVELLANSFRCSGTGHDCQVSLRYVDGISDPAWREKLRGELERRLAIMGFSLGCRRGK